eukprot:CAMPEP_0119549612 /NCGR_PEP_ID=MMETSP1352-20130426/3269_1 /TAXON_ID=265584 /ORGANISM="Stauroneis constricta, Strain CCMP1120" /LENGTH=44 /DNA_ID= /DNA_START= /DNA_END= /DNA_ORIENTATION=
MTHTIIDAAFSPDDDATCQKTKDTIKQWRQSVGMDGDGKQQPTA